LISISSSKRDILYLNCHPLALILFSNPPFLLYHFLRPWSMTAINPLAHSSQFMEEMSLCLLNCLLLSRKHLHHTPSSRLLQHYPLPLSLHLQVLHLPLKPLILVHSTSVDLEKSGYQNSGQSLIAISRSESQLLLSLLQIRMRILIIHSTCLMPTLPLHLNLYLINSLSYALLETYGTKLVRKRWRLTDSMALGRLSNCLPGSVQLVRDGS
jgi:hypothetical protein